MIGRSGAVAGSGGTAGRPTDGSETPGVEIDVSGTDTEGIETEGGVEEEGGVAPDGDGGLCAPPSCGGLGSTGPDG